MRFIARLIVPGLAAASLLAVTETADAATWRLLLDGAAGSTFEAEPAGGPVSNPKIVYQGVLYDTPYPTSPPEYDATSDPPFATYGHLSGAGGGGYGWFWNSAAAGPCAVLSCTIGFDFSNGIYGEYFAATGFMPTDTFSDGTGSGSYEIAPIPLPAGFLLMVSGLAFAGWCGIGRRRS